MTSTLSDHTFRMTRQNNTLQDVPEHPSVQITVKIRVNSVSSVLKDVNTRLNRANMTASRDNKNKNVIVVRGIPPDHGYGQQNILAVIQKFDRGARIVS